jgi:hypothetical protein
MKPACEAYQAGDTTMCGRCGLQWDTNDPEPPRCGKEGVSKRTENTTALRRRFEVHAVKAGIGIGRNGDEYMSFETRTAWTWFQVAYGLAKRDYAAAAGSQCEPPNARTAR